MHLEQLDGRRHIVSEPCPESPFAWVTRKRSRYPPFQASKPLNPEPKALEPYSLAATFFSRQTQGTNVCCVEPMGLCHETLKTRCTMTVEPSHNRLAGINLAPGFPRVMTNL